MAKPKRIPLNRLVKPETFDAVKVLAEALERSEGEVIDQAIEFFEAHNGGEARVAVSYPVPTSSPVPSTLPASIPGVQVGAAGLPKNATCRHCGQRFAGARYASLCPGCRDNGHIGDPRDCGACGEGTSI